MRAAMVARSVGATHAGRVAISEHCQLPHLNRQCEQRWSHEAPQNVLPRGLRKASVVNFTIRIDNASSKRSREAPRQWRRVGCEKRVLSIFITRERRLAFPYRHLTTISASWEIVMNPYIKTKSVP